jgi:hypothetical protein
MPDDVEPFDPRFTALRFAAMLRAAREFGLEPSSVDRISLMFDPRRSNLAEVGEALAEALLAQCPLVIPDAA